MTVSELILPVYGSFCILYILTFVDHFCESFGKPKNGAIFMSLFCIYFLHCSLVYSSTLSFPQFFAIMKLNGTNYKQWVKSLMMNLMIMKLNLVLKVKTPPKPTC